MVAGSVIPAVNPRRRRRSARRNRVHHRRRHARRNPAFLGFQLPGFKSVLFAGVGFAGPALVSGFLTTTFPTVMQQTTNLGIAGKYLVKIGSVLGLAWLTRRFVGSNEASMVMIGGGVNIALTAVNDFAPGFLPANPLSTYIPTSPVGMPGMGMGAYVGLNGQPALSGMRGMRGMRGLNAPYFPMGTAASFGTTYGSAGRAGGYAGTAARYLRY
jgi:hypothetical protein